MTKHIIDATNRNLGRVASEAARALLGKLSPSFKKNEVADVSVEVINVGKMKVLGKKLKNKKYTTYSGYPGGQKILPMETMVAKHGVKKVVEYAIHDMLPKNLLQKRRMKLLKIKE
jgi:large subunit ribosomal protein L13